MTRAQFFSVSRAALASVAFGLMLPALNAQPVAPTQMPADIVKPMPMPMPKAGTDIKQSMDMKPMMTDMQDKMTAMKPTGNMDVDFAMMMRVHHQSAITMAEAELQNGKDPQMRAMAKDIIRAQKKEIAAFDKFLAKRGDASTKMGGPGMQMKK